MPYTKNREYRNFLKSNSDIAKRWRNDSRQVYNKGERDAIYIYEPIDSDEYWGFSPATLLRLLPQCENEGLDVHLNTPGGDMFAASTIIQNLRASGKDIDIYIDGIAASAGSWIAVVGNNRYIADTGSVWIHNAQSYRYGDHRVMARAAEELQKLNDIILDQYENMLTDAVSREMVQGWMDDETLFTAAESLTYGFATEILTADTVTNQKTTVPFDNTIQWDLSFYDIDLPDLPDDPENEQPPGGDQIFSDIKGKNKKALMQKKAELIALNI